MSKEETEKGNIQDYEIKYNRKAERVMRSLDALISNFSYISEEDKDLLASTKIIFEFNKGNKLKVKAVKNFEK